MSVWLRGNPLVHSFLIFLLFQWLLFLTSLFVPCNFNYCVTGRSFLYSLSKFRHHCWTLEAKMTVTDEYSRNCDIVWYSCTEGAVEAQTKNQALQKDPCLLEIMDHHLKCKDPRDPCLLPHNSDQPHGLENDFSAVLSYVAGFFGHSSCFILLLFLASSYSSTSLTC